MKLDFSQTDETSLAALGHEASFMLARRDFSGLAKQFGYALKFDRPTAAALEEDFLSAAASPHEISGEAPEIVVKYFSPNNTCLFALVECYVRVLETASVLMELIVTGERGEMDVTIEHISGASP